jgi:hypothetical protein
MTVTITITTITIVSIVISYIDQMLNFLFFPKKINNLVFFLLSYKRNPNLKSSFYKL